MAEHRNVQPFRVNNRCFLSTRTRIFFEITLKFYFEAKIRNFFLYNVFNLGLLKRVIQGLHSFFYRYHAKLFVEIDVLDKLMNLYILFL